MKFRFAIMCERGKSKLWMTVSALLMSVLLAACAGSPPAPVKDSNSSPGAYTGTPDGSYRVRRGDSLHAIAFKFGLDWRDIARLNGILAPYTIYPDQLLRLTDAEQQTVPGSKASQPATGSSEVRIVAVPLPESTTSSAPDAPRSTTVTVTQPEPGAALVTTTTPSETTPPGVPDKPPVERAQAPMDASYTPPAGGDPSRWIWPTEGRVISSFRADDPSRKGIDIAGAAGQAVIASAPGQIVYSGSGLIGYGELVIIKHSDRMLSAYAHNSRRLVNEGEQVLAGGHIAEMGKNDRNQAVLHFEIRVNGSPQDPLKYLPRR